MVGVNRFTSDAPPSPIEVPDFGALERRQRAAVARARDARDGAAAEQAVGLLEGAARTEEPLMPKILEAVRRRATLGEISDALRRAWGEYRG